MAFPVLSRRRRRAAPPDETGLERGTRSAGEFTLNRCSNVITYMYAWCCVVSISATQIAENIYYALVIHLYKGCLLFQMLCTKQAARYIISRPQRKSLL